jgi:hypothetical protein
MVNKGKPHHSFVYILYSAIENWIWCHMDNLTVCDNMWRYVVIIIRKSNESYFVWNINMANFHKYENASGKPYVLLLY